MRSPSGCGTPLRLAVLAGLVGLAGCGYTTRPGLVTSIRTVYVKPFISKIDITQDVSRDQRFPIYRPGMETDITNEVVHRFQFTGLLRPSTAERADTRLEGELMAFRRDALRYDNGSHVEEWRLNVVVHLRFIDQNTNTVLWEEPNFIGDATYFAQGANAESEAGALERATEDLARRIVERTVENW